jgi:hypothetical protein
MKGGAEYSQAELFRMLNDEHLNPNECTKEDTA